MRKTIDVHLPASLGLPNTRALQSCMYYHESTATIVLCLAVDVPPARSWRVYARNGEQAAYRELSSDRDSSYESPTVSQDGSVFATLVRWEPLRPGVAGGDYIGLWRHRLKTAADEFWNTDGFFVTNICNVDSSGNTLYVVAGFPGMTIGPIEYFVTKIDWQTRTHRKLVPLILGAY